MGTAEKTVMTGLRHTVLLGRVGMKDSCGIDTYKLPRSCKAWGSVAKFDFEVISNNVEPAECPSIGRFTRNIIVALCFEDKLRNRIP